MTVQIIDNFITKEEANTIIRGLSPYLLKSPRPGMSEAQYPDPKSVLFNLYKKQPMLEKTGNKDTDFASEAVTKIIDDIGTKIGNHYDADVVIASSIFAEIVEGGKNVLHCDSIMLDGTPYEDGDGLEDIEFSALLYLNDSGTDYKGGQIHFPNQDILISPESGKLVFFRGDLEHPHEVFEITEGARYTLILFYGRATEVRQYHQFLAESSSA